MTQPLPLCVDLDGTLIRTDMLAEGCLALAGSPRMLSALIALVSGRAAFKQRVAELAAFDPALLPYNETLLARLRSERAAGRTLVLATASDRRVAQAIADHLGLFDEVIASDGINNLKSAAKADALVARFGVRGFVYAGNDRPDIAVWRQAAGAIVVNAPAAVLAQARALGNVESVIEDRAPLAREILRAMRPHQWVKNVLAFVPILTAHALLEGAAWRGGVLMFMAFCATASSIYIVNDLLDLAADRAHPRKRMRPFARGAVALPTGLLAFAALLAVGLGLGHAAGAAWVIAIYALMSVSYSLRLKELPLVDVFMLAGLYTIRLFGGGEATGHRLSLWLLGFSSFLFLSLALLKRVEETMALAKVARRGYTAADTPLLQSLGIGAAFAASIVLALFVQSEADARRYASPDLLWMIVPLLLFWQCRMWLSVARGYMHHDPIVYAARDRVSWAIGIAVMLVLIAAKSMVFPV